MSEKKKRGRPKGSKVKHPENVISVEQAISEGFPLPADEKPKVCVKAGDLVFWVPPRVKSRAFPGILTEAAKFLAKQTLELPIGNGAFITLDVEKVIQDECMAQFYSAIAANPSKKPRKKPANRHRIASKAGGTITPKSQEASRRNLEKAREGQAKYYERLRAEKEAKEAGKESPYMPPKNLLPLKKDKA